MLDLELAAPLLTHVGEDGVLQPGWVGSEPGTLRDGEGGHLGYKLSLPSSVSSKSPCPQELQERAFCWSLQMAPKTGSGRLLAVVSLAGPTGPWPPLCPLGSLRPLALSGLRLPSTPQAPACHRAPWSQLASTLMTRSPGGPQSWLVPQFPHPGNPYCCCLLSDKSGLSVRVLLQHWGRRDKMTGPGSPRPPRAVRDRVARVGTENRPVPVLVPPQPAV
jgi:hypothetical protein